MQRFRLSWLFVSFSALVSISPACGDDGAPGGSTTQPGSSSEADDDTSGTSTLGGSATSVADPSTTGGTASVDDTATLGEVTTDADDDTGPPPSRACEVDEDCVLVNDCCTCDALPQGEPRPPCPEDSACLVDACTAHGVPDGVVPRCLGGQCVLRTSCSANGIACNAIPPSCADGELAEVAGGCWTGDCVAAEHCDVVPACELCPDGRACIRQELLFPMQPENFCLPISPECTDGEPTCACMGEPCEPYLCSDEGEDITCFCPMCG